MACRRFKTSVAVLLLSLVLGVPPLFADSLRGWAALPFCATTEPTFFVGYFSQTRVPTLSLNINPGNGLQQFSHRIAAEGVWTEFVLPFKCGRFGLIVGGGYLFPSTRESLSEYAGSEGPAARSWRTSTQWFNFRTALTYDLMPSCTLLAGLRIEDFMASGKDPIRVTGNLGSPTDHMNFTFQGYFPFIGLLLHRSFMAGAGQVNVGVVGWPALWGNFDYKESVHTFVNIAGTGFPTIAASNNFGPGYFLEAFAECSIPIWYFNLGAFFKFDAFAATATVHLAERLGFTNALGVARFPKVDAELNFDVRNWTVGGQIGIPF